MNNYISGTYFFTHHSSFPFIIFPNENPSDQPSLCLPEEPGHTRHFEMGKYLKEHGHELVIVASDLNYQTGQRTVERRGLFAEQIFDGVRVLRSYIYPRFIVVISGE